MTVVFSIGEAIRSGTKDRQMLFLLFHLGDEQFALDASAVVEVVPTVELRPVHGAPDYMAGLFDFRLLDGRAQLAIAHPGRCSLSGIIKSS